MKLFKLKSHDKHVPQKNRDYSKILKEKRKFSIYYARGNWKSQILNVVIAPEASYTS